MPFAYVFWPEYLINIQLNEIQDQYINVTCIDKKH